MNGVIDGAGMAGPMASMTGYGSTGHYLAGDYPPPTVGMGIGPGDGFGALGQSAVMPMGADVPDQGQSPPAAIGQAGPGDPFDMTTRRRGTPCVHRSGPPLLVARPPATPRAGAAPRPLRSALGDFATASSRRPWGPLGLDGTSSDESGGANPIAPRSRRLRPGIAGSTGHGDIPGRKGYSFAVAARTA